MKATPPIPDGGWGWLVVVACCINSFVVASMARVFGVVIIELMDKFQCSSARVAVVLSVGQFCRYIVAPLSGVAVNRFGCRPTVFFGGVLTGVGIFLGAFSTSLTMLYVTYGAMTGLGHCFIYTPSNIIIGAYFEKRRATATALVGIGASLSGFVLPPLLRWLFAEYGVQGCLLILAAISLHPCAGAMVMRPLESKKDVELVAKPAEDAAEKTAEPSANAAFLPAEKVEPETSDDVKKQGRCSACLTWLGLDFSLLCHPPFLAFIIAHCMTNPTLVASWAFIPLLGVSKGIAESRAAFLLSVHALSDLIGGRLVAAFLLDAAWIRRRRYLLTPIVNLVFCVVMVGLYFSRTEVECFFWSSVYGMFHGVYVILRSLVLQDLFGRERLSSLFSFNNFSIGVGMLTMPVLVGLITDATSVDKALVFLAVVFVVGAALFGAVAVKKWKTGTVT